MALCGSATCLGLPEWTECCRQKSRFASILTDEEAEKLSAGYTPNNTEKANKWAVKNYEEWQKWRNEQRPQDQAPSCTELFSSGDANFAMLSRLGVRRDGSIHQLPYTIYFMVCNAICYPSTQLLLGFSTRRTRHSKSSMALWTIFSVACTIDNI